MSSELIFLFVFNVFLEVAEEYVYSTDYKKMFHIAPLFKGFSTYSSQGHSQFVNSLATTFSYSIHIYQSQQCSYQMRLQKQGQ